VPLWFAEGMAEYFSLGMEPGAEMFVRDGSITGYLPPLEWAGGYLVYKAGQCAIDFLIERHGEERFRDMLRRLRQMRSFDRAFQRTYGMSPRRFDEQWREAMRKKYWPTVAKLDRPEAFAKRLTDHSMNESALNWWPSVSPQGDRIAWFSDLRQYTDVFVMSAYDGRVLHRVVRGERNVEFEGFPLLRTSITWSPDGERLAFVAGSQGHDRLYVVNSNNGDVIKRLDLPCDQLSYPAWSPVSDTLVVLGLKSGRSDLWIVNAETGRYGRLTDDAWDEKEPTWSPDGRRITFASDRLAPVVLHPMPVKDGYGRYGIYEFDLETRETSLLLDTSGDDHGPAWSPDGRRLVFITDRNGSPNLSLFDPADSTITQLTDLTGGVQSVSWSRQNDRLVFSAFDRGGWDIFAVQEPLTLDPVVSRLRRNAPGSVMTLAEARDGDRELVSNPDSSPTGALAGAWPDSTTVPDTTAGSGERRGSRPALPTEPARPAAFEPPPWEGGGFPTPASTTLALGDGDTDSTTHAAHDLAEDDGGPFALPDSVLGQTPARYRWRLAPEAIQIGGLAASSYGFAGSTQLLFSDFLGDHSLYLAADILSNAIADANALVQYSVLSHRLDWNVAAFHFKNYFDSQVTSLGEQLNNAQLFSERAFGGSLGWVYPFDRFRRIEARYTQMFVEEEFFQRRLDGSVVSANREYRSVSSPTFSLVGDNSLMGSSGPVNGGRWNFTYSPAFAWFPNGLEFQTVTGDVRQYRDLTGGYSFATRLLGGVSVGQDAQAFRVGGFSTIRGYPDFELIGTRLVMANAELRFPFVDDLGLVGPVPLGRLRLRGAMFADVGTIWNEDRLPRLAVTGPQGWRLQDTFFSFGAGIRTWFLALPMKLDVAWPTNFESVEKPRWHFSIGPEF